MGAGVMSRMQFEQVKRSSQKRMPCDGCGKVVTRKETRWQTLNPFNRNATGEPKTVEEVHAELGLELEAWRRIPVVCKACATSGRLWQVEWLAGNWKIRNSDHFHGYTGVPYPTGSVNHRIVKVAADNEDDARRFAANLFFGDPE